MAATSKRMDFSRFPRKYVPKHEALFFEEDDSRALYVLLTGALGVFRDEIQVATIDEPLTMIGEMSALTGQPRNATVRALEPTTLVSIENPDALFEEYPQLGAKLARLLAERLAVMTSKFVDLKGVVNRRRVLGGLAEVPAIKAKMDADTLPPGMVPANGEAAPSPPAVPAPTPTPAPVPLAAAAAVPEPEVVEPRQLDEVIGALSDLLDWDPSMSALT